MTPNTTNLYVRLRRDVGDAIQLIDRSIAAWDDDGSPLIPGRYSLVRPEDLARHRGYEGFGKWWIRDPRDMGPLWGKRAEVDD